MYTKEGAYVGHYGTVHHPGYGSVAGFVSVTMPLLSINTLQLLLSTRAGPAEDNPPLYKYKSEG